MTGTAWSQLIGCRRRTAQIRSPTMRIRVAAEPVVYLRAVAEPAPPLDAAGIRTKRTNQDLHQRALAGAVLADQTNDLPRVQGQVHATQHPAPAADRQVPRR
jgi:hypothetical protein